MSNAQPLIRFKDLPYDELHARLAAAGISAAQARRLQVSVIRRSMLPDPVPGGLSGRALEQVRRLTAIPNLQLFQKRVSEQDGFAAYVFRGEGPDLFEAVRIPLLHRAEDKKYIVCVSSQVGCRLGCAFCVTGRLGFRRNLATWEMVDQVLKIRNDSEHPVRGVVFMGMGEPLLNYDAVIRACRILSEPCGLAISGKAITISTAGIAPAIRRFAAEGHRYRLIVSLASADPAQRRALMPVEAEHPLSDVMAALRMYHEASSQRVTLAWPMLAGVNTREEDARQLARLTAGLPVRLDLMDVNDPAGRFQPPSEVERNAFRDALRKHLAMPVARRYSGGRDIHAACGMLAGR